MAIIRVPIQEDGKRLTQSLWIAKMIAGMYKLEFIQDFGQQTSLGKHITEVIKFAKEKKQPHFLRIPKRIQTINCERHLNGERICPCDQYVPDETDEYNLNCQNKKCSSKGHIHKVFQSYEDLTGMPCILILVNKGTMGNTFPKSLVALDDRSVNEKAAPYLVPFTQEKGRLCRYISNSQRGKPYMYLGPNVYNQLFQSLNVDCSYFYSFVDRKNIDTKVRFADNQLKPTENHADSHSTNDTNKPRLLHFLLTAEPQCGKTGVYLFLISLLRQIVGEENEIETSSSSSDESDEEIQIPDEPFRNTVPYWKDMEKMKKLPKTISSGKYNRFTGKYEHPVDQPPVLPKRRKTKHMRPRSETVKHSRIYVNKHRFTNLCG